ncbi:hypothetical protein [Sulfitobacter geojensis]|jgi:hypothetical protein|uniref:Uncharacterized protein n=1 Tax=Sulfitobacter geojensis TaxID=1342299 RepID=A0AAE3B629_9RHOB|nr:hypothetical protein [Sulfitobacter geojensis]MBM1688759.1 hypothetical protein [Sulfitobacter geojensis]MBM1692826.1 hypothetical protein [Sulfitobacter geojensis]MBM1704992.1 hypothetical protein [Sulfitobacter geojensis]MBM1709050.1 hypothetical protein [Sulfitobacter geojensis]MBM1713115.1 hypothetical protein [Sulfitobacter geojensis]
MRRLCFSLICAVLPLPAMAQSYLAVNRLNVVPISATSFEVIEGRGEGARGMWCAAADYVLNGQRQSGNPRLYVQSPRGPSVTVAGRKGAVFTTDASSLPDGPKQSYSVSVRTAGLGLPLAHAYQFCKDYQIELEDILLRRADQ